MQQRFEAIQKLKEMNNRVNIAFEREYLKYFNLKKNSFVPHISEFMKKPPENEIMRQFWIYFCDKYPGTDNPDTQKIFLDIYNM